MRPRILSIVLAAVVTVAGMAIGATSAAAGRTPASDPSSGSHVEDTGPVNVWAGGDGRQLRAAAVPGAVACDGDGTSGKRVQILYLREASQADRLVQFRSSFQQWATQIDQQFLTDAQTTGGYRRVRFAHDSSCVPTVSAVVLPAGTLGNFDNTFNAIKSAGYNRTDRKYLAYSESTAWCGVGSYWVGRHDPRPGTDNPYNSGPELASVGTGCWTWQASAHELLHSLGAVLPPAPHGTPNGHCWDDEDIMCYDDGSLPPGGLVTLCPGIPENTIDCNHDDYYSTKPAAGSWLASHWNVASSQFLITAPKLDFTAYPALDTGAAGAPVETAEYLLQQAGQNPGAIDQSYDAASAAAASAFRTAIGQPAGASVDSHVWTALLSAGTKPALQSGSSGNDVRRLQRALTAALGRSIPIDGAFGPGTAQAVRDYQSSRGLKADAIVGAATWTALQAGR